MDPAWIGVVGALGGVLVGGIAESIRARFAFRREKRWSGVEEKRRRLEMIYEALEQVGESYGHNLAPLLAELATGNKVTQPSEVPKVPWAHLRMLVNLYRPSLLSQLAEVETAGPLVGEAMARGIMGRSGDRQRDIILGERIMSEYTKLTKAIATMRNAIVEESRMLDQSVTALVGD